MLFCLEEKAGGRRCPRMPTCGLLPGQVDHVIAALSLALLRLAVFQSLLLRLAVIIGLVPYFVIWEILLLFQPMGLHALVSRMLQIIDGHAIHLTGRRGHLCGLPTDSWIGRHLPRVSCPSSQDSCPARPASLL